MNRFSNWSRQDNQINIDVKEDEEEEILGISFKTVFLIFTSSTSTFTSVEINFRRFQKLLVIFSAN